MNAPDPAYLQRLATECVRLVANQYHRQLDWSPESLTVLDEVCGKLLADGPLNSERLDLWCQLIGGYTGEVVVRTYAGTWTMHEKSPNAPAVGALGVTAFPFVIATRVLTGEPYKSLASFIRGLPLVADRSRTPSGT